MRRLIWPCLAILYALFALTMVFFYPFRHPFYEELGRAAYVVQPVLMLQPFCALWMVYQAIRHEKSPIPYVFLALFVPFAYVWYYLEKVRTRKSRHPEREREHP